MAWDSAVGVLLLSNVGKRGISLKFNTGQLEYLTQKFGYTKQKKTYSGAKLVVAAAVVIVLVQHRVRENTETE